MNAKNPFSSRPHDPTLVRYEDVPRAMWGDADAGLVIDWLYPTSDKLHFTMFSLRPGAFWRHTEDWKPVYGADEGFYVLQGSFTMHNPETGEVCVAHEGETMHFRAHTWHYGYNFTSVETIVVETFAPCPAEGEFTVEAMRLAAPPLKRIIGGRHELMDNWPWNAENARATETIKTLREEEWLHIIQGETKPVRVSLFVATDKLTMGRFDLLPGATSDAEVHPGDEVALVTKGRLHIYLPQDDQVFELNPLDAFFAPEGTKHRYFNMGDETTTVVFGVAPRYL